jgi:hypothetical protein
VTSGFGQVSRAATFWAPTALLSALALPLQTDGGLLVVLGVLAAALTAVALVAVVVRGRAFVPRVAPTGSDVDGALRGFPARQHDPDAAGRVRPRAPGRVCRQG